MARFQGGKWAVAVAVFFLGIPIPALGFTLRAPTTISVTIQGDNITSTSARSRAAGDFVEAEVLADFGCPSGYIIERMRMSTPHNWREVDVSNTRARVLANRTMPWTELVSIPELRAACSQGKSYVDVSIKLSAVCAHSSSSDFDSAILTPRESKTIRVNLSCNNVVAPRYVPAKASAAKYLQDCPNVASGIEGLNQPSRVTATARPLRCGSGYSPSDPKLTRVRVFQSRHYCPTGQIIDRFARRRLTFDRMGAPTSQSFGKVRWCHAYVNPDPYLNQEATVQRGKIRANLLGSSPSYTVTGESKFRFQPNKAPAPAGLPVCKRVDFFLVDENQLMAVASGGSSSCSNTTRTVTVGLNWPGPKNAAKIKCINEANRLKRQNKWSSLPSVGSGKKFSTTSSFSLGLIGHYCYGGSTPSGSNWSYSVHCGDFKHQSEWNAITSVGFDLECWSK